MLARAETWDNGKPIRETMAADIPLVVDHFRYFTGVIWRHSEEGSVWELGAKTVSMNVPEQLGVVAQIIPWNWGVNLPICSLKASWRLQNNRNRQKDT